MPYREVRVVDLKEALRRWLAGEGIRATARNTGLDRNTIRPLLRAAGLCGLKPGDPFPDDVVLQKVLQEAQRPALSQELGSGERLLMPYREQIRLWIETDHLLLTKVQELLARQGARVPYPTLHRFARKWCEFGRSTAITVRRSDVAAGEVAEVDFGRLGLLQDLGSARPRVLYAFVMVLGYSRLSCVIPTFRQDLESVIACFEAAFEFFAGCPRRVVIDNVKACVDLADPYTPRFQRGFLEYAAFRGFLPDPARPRHPRDKPLVERHVPYVRKRFFQGETFVDLNDVARRAVTWCREVAGRRIHGTTRRVPLEVFEAEERTALLPLQPVRFDTPRWSRCTVHPDHHVRFDHALYSVPTHYVGKTVDVRGDRSLVRIYLGAELIKTHPRQSPGTRSTDFDDYPKDRAPYAMRFPDFYCKKARGIGSSAGAFADRLLAGEFPWSRLRQAQKLLRLAERYGAARLDAACRRALSFDLIDVHRVQRILEQALEHQSSTELARGQLVQAEFKFLRPSRHFSHQPDEGDPDADPA
jgi:transposase